jgi:uncharacterized protein (TIGR02246 family)
MTLSNADVTEMHQLYAAYCLAVDDGDGKAFSSCFTEDGSVDTGGPSISGTDQLESFAEGVPASVPGIRHVVSNVHVVGDGDDAQGRAYVIAYSAAGGKASLLITGRYRDSLRRVDGTWLFAKRHFTPDS